MTLHGLRHTHALALVGMKKGLFLLITEDRRLLARNRASKLSDSHTSESMGRQSRLKP